MEPRGLECGYNELVRHIVDNATFIALRARRQGYQIAADILYPKVKDVKPPAVRDWVWPAEPKPKQKWSANDVVRGLAWLLLIPMLLALLGLALLLLKY